MKKILFVWMMLTGLLAAASLQLEAGYEKALSKAQAQDRPVMLVLSSHSCRYCDLFDQETLADDQVIKALNRDFVNTVVYAAEGQYVPRQLITGATPTIWFLKPSGEPMFQPIMGAVGKEDFIKALAIVHDAYTSKKQ
jgi:thioredoxin-related protein